MVQRPHVVIVGGGFGGLTCARTLARADVDVTLIDRQNHHLFQPLLYQVAMAGLSPSEIAAPIRSIVRKQRNIRVLLAEVEHIDLAQREITYQPASEPMHYDYLVLAPGARTAYFGHDDWELYAPGLKSIDDAVEIRRRVLLAFEAAEREADAEKRAQLLSFVVIGGGPTGVEMAGAVAELSRFALGRDFRQAAPSEARVLLIEGGPRLLPTFDPKLSEKTVQQLSELGVHVRTSTIVDGITAQGVRLRTGELLQADTVLWAAGVACSPLIAALGVETDRQGRAMVEQDCSLPGFPEAFVIGDSAHFEYPKGKILPGVSPTAMQMGRHVAHIISDEAGNPTPVTRKSFRYTDKGSMATIGRSRAIAQVQDLKLSGVLAWLAWLGVHIWYLIGFRNRFLVLFDWAWSYITYRRGARLITGGRLQPGAPHSLMPGAPRHLTNPPVPAPQQVSAPATNQEPSLRAARQLLARERDH
jgi:NADH:ubiquinone reductase (H+-translocating)